MGVPKVLLVEDERIVALSLKQCLKKLGYDVVGIAASGEQAMQAIKENKPEVVLMDIHIQGQMDGIDTAARLREDDHAAVIYLTAYSEEATLARAQKTEPYGYLMKPFSERELHATIQMALARQKADIAGNEAREELSRTNAELEAGIEERRHAERVATETSSLLSTVLNAVPVPLLVTNVVGGLLAWNAAARAAYGYDSEEISGLDMSPLFTGQAAAAVSRTREEALNGVTVREVELTARHRDGRSRSTVLVASPVKTPDGDVVALVFCIQDVSESKSVEAQLRHAQKMEAMGQLTGGIAHDFNNLLAIIMGNLELLEEELAPDTPARQLVANAFDAGLRGANLTRRLLAYSRAQPLAPSRVDLCQLVKDESRLFRRSLEESIDIAVNCQPDIEDVVVDSAQLRDALLNLALNARDAMPKGGKLSIEVANVELDEDYAETNLDVVPGRYVQVAISDTGTGMSQTVLQHVTEPFFTTKEVGKGSGLGLSMVYGFVKQSGGHLKIYSEVGVGTTIKLYLPVAADGEADDVAPSEVPTSLPMAAPGETVLLIEDDETVRRVAKRFLDSLGYAVVEAGNGREALKVVSSDQRIDLMLSDVVLPSGMSGPDILAEARSMRPGLPALYMSGYTSNALSLGEDEDDHIHLLSKPFLKRDLARKIRLILDTEVK